MLNTECARRCPSSSVVVSVSFFGFNFFSFIININTPSNVLDLATLNSQYLPG
jgi:hypothetical protein